MKKFRYKSTLMVTACMLLLFSSCRDYMADKVYQVWEGKMIDEYVGEESNLTQFYQIILQSDYEGMLHGYGSYTCFAPVDSAVENYLQGINRTLESLTTEECNAIIRYHVIRDSIATADFEDGRLSSPTISGSYLTSKTESDISGNVWIRINRQARLIVENFSAGNGIVHTCDAVLTPSDMTIFETLEVNYPDSLFSIMKHFMKYSSYSPDSIQARIDSFGVDTLAQSWLTMFVQDNQSFIDLGIGIENVDLTQDDAMTQIDSILLIRLHDNQKSVDSDAELLKQFADYHLAPSLNYVADLLKISTLLSCVTNQVMSVKVNVDQLILNYFVLGSTIEPGVGLYRKSEYSDMSASNGVIQYIGGMIEVKNRSSYRVNWDMADQPEIQALKNFRTGDGSYTAFTQGSLANVDWGGGTYTNYDIGYQQYTNFGSSFDVKTQYVNGDAMRFRFSPNINAYFEWKLPLLVEGKYKVWLCWRREQSTTFRTVFRQEGKDDQVLPYVFNLGEYMATDRTHAERLQNGWKQYNAKMLNSVVNSALLGTIVVESTGVHSIRFECLTGRSGETSWDLLQFIPTDDDQVWPMMDIKGKLIYEDTPDCEIWPYTYKNSKNYQGDCEW